MATDSTKKRNEVYFDSSNLLQRDSFNQRLFSIFGFYLFHLLYCRSSRSISRGNVRPIMPPLIV